MPSRDDLAQLGFGLIAEFCHRHVEGVVAGALAARPSTSRVDIPPTHRPSRLGQHISMYVVVPPISAAMLAGLVRVFGKGRHEGQIDVHVRIDETRKDELSRASMTSVSGGRFEVCADASDGFVFDVDVGAGSANPPLRCRRFG